MTERAIRNDYFQWLYDSVCGNRYSKYISFKRLLEKLHNTTFRYSIPKDQNRAEDGVDLRYRYSLQHKHECSIEYIIESIDSLVGPCTVLEMMIGLAVRCEEDMMDNPDIGNRTGQWFWGMIVNLGLGSMTDERYDERIVEEAIDRLLNRNYDPDGTGGLFTVRNCDKDLRRVEIWFQLCWYLNSIT